MELAIASFIILALGAALFIVFKKLQQRSSYIQELQLSLARYAPITDMEKALDAKNQELNTVQKEIDQAFEAQATTLNNIQQDIAQAQEAKNKELIEIEKETGELRLKYQAGKELLAKLEHELGLYDSRLDLIDFGIYTPIFNLDTSEDYKDKITQVLNKQKELVQLNKAAICTTSWTVGGSEKQGELMVRRYMKLMLRAFNGESDSLIAKVRWNNITLFEERIKRAHEAINKLGSSNQTHITNGYLQLKLDELHLTHELELKKYEEKEEQRMIREQMREEEKAQRELEKAQKEAEDEERRFERALEQAHRRLEKAQGDEVEQLSRQILELQLKLAQAHEAKERAISRAQTTRSGHVYIISNIGSFGENKYKIGMTRRLEPLDRVKELSDASVPFEFDVHAMVYSDDAPTLEYTLHKVFNNRRLNMINTRKEFFNVSLEEIAAVIQNHSTVELHLTKLAEAREYRETLALLRGPVQEPEPMLTSVEFSESLF